MMRCPSAKRLMTHLHIDEHKANLIRSLVKMVDLGDKLSHHIDEFCPKH